MLAPSGATALLCRGVVSLLPVSYDLAAREQCKGNFVGNGQYGALWPLTGPGEKGTTKLGRVVEWQTRWTQNPLAARP